MGAYTPLSADHGEIHDRLARAARESGPLGEAAKRVARHFARHAEKEERLVTPLLALLPRAAQAKPDPAMATALPLFGEFKASLDEMVAEHHVISAGLEALVKEAHAAERAEFGALAARLVAHMRLEEEVIYPAALLLGRYLRLRLGD
jgi:hypothetical protein